MHENSLLSSLLFSSLLILNSCGKKDNKTEEIRADLLQKLETSRQKVVQELIEPGYPIGMQVLHLQGLGGSLKSATIESPFKNIIYRKLEGRQFSDASQTYEPFIYEEGIGTDSTIGSDNSNRWLVVKTLDEIYANCKRDIEAYLPDDRTIFELQFEESGYLQICKKVHLNLADSPSESYHIYKTTISMP